MAQKKVEASVVRMNSLVLVEALPLDLNPVLVYLNGLKLSGRYTQTQALNIASRIMAGCDCMSLNWAKIEWQHVDALRSVLIEMYHPAMSNKILCAVRGVLKRAWMLNLLSAEDYHKAVSVGGVRGETVPAGRELTMGEISALMDACVRDRTSAGVRDAAIIGLLYSGGVRRAEVIGLRFQDFTPENGKLIIRGKGSKERTLYLNNGGLDVLIDWLNVRGSELGSLFNPINKAGEIVNRELSNQAVYNILVKRGKEAGVSHFSPHDFRRTFVSNLLEAGADLTTVSKMCGHASVVTTARYDRRGEDAKQKASQLLHLPYVRRSK